jgi:hypothetical protein
LPVRTALRRLRGARWRRGSVRGHVRHLGLLFR